MTNPHRGEVAFEAEGASYTLLFSVDALCALEEAAGGKGIVALSAELSDPDRMTMSLLRKVVWAGLRERHPGVDLKAAGELILAAGGLAAVMQHVSLALERAFPPTEQRPRMGQPQAQNGHGTGPNSIAAGASSVATTTPSGTKHRARSA